MTKLTPEAEAAIFAILGSDPDIENLVYEMNHYNETRPERRPFDGTLTPWAAEQIKAMLGEDDAFIEAYNRESREWTRAHDAKLASNYEKIHGHPERDARIAHAQEQARYAERGGDEFKSRRADYMRGYRARRVNFGIVPGPGDTGPAGDSEER